MRGQFSARWGSLQRWQKRGRGRDGPENGTDPSWFGGGKAFLTLGTQGTGAAIAEASRIHETVGPIPLWSAFLRIERVVGGATQGPVRLKRKSGSWKATGKGGAGPLRGAIRHRRRRRLRGNRRDGGSRGSLSCGSKFGQAHRSGRQLLSQFEAQIPHPLTENLPELLPTRQMRNPAIRVLFLIFVSQDRFE